MLEESLFVTRRGRGLYTRTMTLPLSSRFYVLAVLVQAVVLIGVNTAISILTADCLSALVLGLGSVTTLFMSYFAIEAVRTENRYQLAAYAVTSAIFLASYVPTLVGSCLRLFSWLPEELPAIDHARRGGQTSALVSAKHHHRSAPLPRRAPALRRRR